MKLPREEYIEQAYLFRSLHQRLDSNEPVQILLAHAKEEILTTTKLPMAIDFILAELNHCGSIATAMQRMSHYFTPFQTFLIAECERERGRMDMFMATRLLESEARYRASDASIEGLFFFQFEVLCRNRISYDKGLEAMAKDVFYDDIWRKWLLGVRNKIGIVDLSDLIYVHSQYYLQKITQLDESLPPDHPILFDEKVGRIALANRRKEPIYFFAALQRHLDYPPVPRVERRSEIDNPIPRLIKTVERLEMRVKLLEDEQRQSGIDLAQFMKKPG
ncbi:MAG TPA: hypothetical protein PKD64_15025 [Pirellulaceae bacterium]|nr:hypothetical protein [Pirellulaceae bacterium]HMO93496.1 hypothetical protein [Pirellulaceae bacterium]HMP70401.1 hypothetical protein [Pirellulaceae bacterium]